MMRPEFAGLLDLDGQCDSERPMPSSRTSVGALLLVLVAVLAGLFVAVDAISAVPTGDQRLTVYKARHFVPVGEQAARDVPPVRFRLL